MVSIDVAILMAADPPFLEQLLDWVELSFARWGYLIVFVGRFAENAAFVGAVVPGDLILLLGGFYAERGAVELGPVIALGFVGAILGDSAGYALGRLAGRRIVERWGGRFWLPHDRLERIDRYFREYGVWAVALGRITPIVRTLNTFAAGMSRMPFGHFLLAAALAGAAWSVALTAVGFAFSGSLSAVQHSLGAGGVGLFVVFVGVIVWTYRRMSRRIERERQVPPGDASVVGETLDGPSSDVADA